MGRDSTSCWRWASWLRVLPLAGLLALVIACDRQQPAAAPDAALPAANAHPSAGTPGTAATPALPPEARSGEPTADYPADLPLYSRVPGADARVVGAVTRPGRGRMLTLRSSDPPERIYAYYKDAFVDEGWELQSELSTPTQRILDARKDDRRASLSITTSQSGGDSQVLLTVVGEG